MRNDVLKAVSEAKGGIATLRRWSQAWADGRMHPSIVRIFVSQMIRPIKKDNGKPRNISLMEALFKLASGVVQDCIRNRRQRGDDTAEGLHWSQYGGQSAGPELMLLVHQGMMKLRPDLAYSSLDAANAYGEVKRAAMLRGTSEWCPSHAAFLACQWRAVNEAWIEEEPNVWRRVEVMEGTAQGDTSSTPAFSRGLRPRRYQKHSSAKSSTSLGSSDQ